VCNHLYYFSASFSCKQQLLQRVLSPSPSGWTTRSRPKSSRGWAGRCQLSRSPCQRGDAPCCCHVPGQRQRYQSSANGL